MRHALSALAALIACVAISPALAVEFDAAIGRQGFGRCHMDGCGFFVIDAAVPVGSTKDGTLFAISAREWGAEYRRHGDDDEHEYDHPPVSVSPKMPRISMVFCSKTKPVLFDFFEGKWQSTFLRPGDENAVFGATESANLFYYAACHHFITKDPVSKAMALRLGYKFANEPQKEDAPEPDDTKQPMDMLK